MIEIYCMRIRKHLKLSNCIVLLKHFYLEYEQVLYMNVILFNIFLFRFRFDSYFIKNYPRY